ncbi:MAG: protein translocase subunit SecD [Acidobacteria bacterium]|nr:protein translocase subunit SecD [Acidobacteriota bacterium]
MDKKIIYRIVLILVVVGLAAWSVYPPSERINYGLDLSGGVHLVLQVQTDDAIKAELDDATLRLASVAEEQNITLGTVLTDPETLSLTFDVPAGADRAVLAEIVLDYFGDYDAQRGADSWTLKFKPNTEKMIRDQAVRKGLETINNRIDEFGVAEPRINRQGIDGDRILVQLPGVDDPERVKDIISKTAFLQFKEVLGGPAPDRASLLQATGGSLSPDAEILPGSRSDFEGNVVGRDFYLVKKVAIVTGRELRTARRSQDEYGQANVRFDLQPSAADKFGAYTESHIGTPMAIVLDDRVMSAPVIRARITDSGVIEGNYSIEEAEDLALVLRAGALPARLIYLEERTVGPSLGHDSVVRGLRAIVAGLILVMLFMVIYYKLSGINAVLALILNLLLLMGAMAYFGATLTLPGIAGVVLTIGMAVDANVLIFERIREELKVGKTVRAAIDTGFGRAFGTILDANMTTLIAALFLFQFGTGPIKGFAVTLSIGILASMFTAVFMSRTLYMILMRGRDRVQTLSV